MHANLSCQVSCGYSHTLVVAATDQVFAFGGNSRNQLGCDTGAHVTKTQQFDCVFTPTPVPLLAGKVVSNYINSGALDKDGRPMLWGGQFLAPTLVRRCVISGWRGDLHRRCAVTP